MCATIFAGVTSNVSIRAVILKSVSPRLQGSQVVWRPRHDLYRKARWVSRTKARGMMGGSAYPIRGRAGADVEFLVGVMARVAVKRHGDD